MNELTVTTLTIKVAAFGETREVVALLHEWADEKRGVYSTRITTYPVFAARFRTGKKVWRADATVRPSKADPTVYEPQSLYRTLLNNSSAHIFGWYDAAKHETRKSQHNSAF